MKRLTLIFVLTLVVSLTACKSLIVKVNPEHIENNALEMTIAEFESGLDGFEQVKIKLKNNSNTELELSGESFFEDIKGQFKLVYLPPKMSSGSTRTVALYRTYKGAALYVDNSTSFSYYNFSENAKVTEMDLDDGSKWRVDESDLNTHDIYLTLIFKIGENTYSNAYHLHN